ncbi:MAG: bifunctional folylpolyglutamate synthase/dihydrofolate synthase [Alphaproteobacteria bacterium]|nr:bifunctional folylpolyglutamate synthase/dihydrofolate synthase [Alphaproteobacteria bacterium]
MPASVPRNRRRASARQQPPADNSLSIDAYLQRLTLLHPKAIDLSLDRIGRLLAKLEHPERRLPPTIHVAGTNGKGSVVAYTRAILEAAGYVTHVYTSPHLIRFNERIRVGGRLIDDEPLLALLEECDRVNASEPITFFEITTVAAFLAFSRHPADALILEVGLGGRFDTTNTIPTAAATAITPVSYDHIGFLGDTLGKIAFEKAGILKPNVPAVIGPQVPEAMAVISRRAADVGARTVAFGDQWSCAPSPSGLRVTVGSETLDLPAPALPGVHQSVNAGIAVTLARQLAGFHLPVSAIARGLAAVSWPGRLQRLARGPLTALLPESVEVWLDGAHNPAGGEALAATLRAWSSQDRPPRPLHIIIGMMGTKDAGGFLRHLAGLAPRVVCIAIPGEKTSFPAEALAGEAEAVGMRAVAANSLAAAVQVVARDIGPPPALARVVICGSIYLAGAVLKENGFVVT